MFLNPPNPDTNKTDKCHSNFAVVGRLSAMFPSCSVILSISLSHAQCTAVTIKVQFRTSVKRYDRQEREQGLRRSSLHLRLLNVNSCFYER